MGRRQSTSEKKSACGDSANSVKIAHRQQLLDPDMQIFYQNYEVH